MKKILAGLTAVLFAFTFGLSTVVLADKHMGSAEKKMDGDKADKKDGKKKDAKKKKTDKKDEKKGEAPK